MQSSQFRAQARVTGPSVDCATRPPRGHAVVRRGPRVRPNLLDRQWSASAGSGLPPDGGGPSGWSRNLLIDRYWSSNLRLLPRGGNRRVHGCEQQVEIVSLSLGDPSMDVLKDSRHVGRAGWNKAGEGRSPTGSVWEGGWDGLSLPRGRADAGVAVRAVRSPARRRAGARSRVRAFPGRGRRSRRGVPNRWPWRRSAPVAWKRRMHWQAVREEPDTV